MREFWAILIEDVDGHRLLKSEDVTLKFDSFELTELYRCELAMEYYERRSSDRTWACSSVYVSLLSNKSWLVKNELGGVVCQLELLAA
ncbi:hypothetical protein DBX26_24960 (plasmid) [Vibrio sp. dhg]|jgi:hypothetical protein|nr:hypothetical protein DBX26_24960 [Vibrio sp. dhg]